MQGTGLLALSPTNTINTSASVNTGTAVAGDATIQHDGGPNNVAFTIGDASQNGTAGGITTGSSSLTTGTFPVLSNGGTASGTPSGITITSLNSAPTLTPTTVDLDTNSPTTFTLAGLGINVSDANGDNTNIQITQIFQGTLTDVEGSSLTVGSVVSPTQTLIYTPPDGLSGSALDAFQIQAFDFDNGDAATALSTSSVANVTFSATATTATPIATDNIGNDSDRICATELCQELPPPALEELSLESACNAFDPGGLQPWTIALPAALNATMASRRMPLPPASVPSVKSWPPPLEPEKPPALFLSVLSLRL